MPANIEVAKPLTFVAATPMPAEASKPTDTVADLNLSFNVAYSWGIGNSYVLATKEEENKFTPYEISQDMYRKKVDGEFTNLNPLTVAWGTLHVVAKAMAAEEKAEDFQLEESVFEVPDELFEEIKSESKIGRKRKRQDIEAESSPDKSSKWNS